MQRKEAFIEELTVNGKYAKSTISKYANAIDTISKELGQGSLYNISDPAIIESMTSKYLSIPQFRDKDVRGNRMYSNALKQYKFYLESK